MTDEDMHAPVNPHTTPSNPALENLGRLVGRWQVQLGYPADPSNKMRVQAAFDWLEGGAFVIEHLASSTWIIGQDDSNKTYSVLYHDERGISRVYQMSLDNATWKMWRNSPGFSQRFEGNFSEAFDTITDRWEKSFDGSTWEHDFDLTYKRVREAPEIAEATLDSKTCYYPIIYPSDFQIKTRKLPQNNQKMLI